MKTYRKAVVEIRRKREEARRNQTTSTKVSKPEKSFKVNLGHFKLKTVLGRGGYGKVKME